MSDRYSRQILCDKIGEAGQKQLGDSKVLLIGCGGLGTIVADQLVRAGVGHLTIVDRDDVAKSNLQRQSLFMESDVGQPKASVAYTRLRSINKDVWVGCIVGNVTEAKLNDLITTERPDLIVDATDNFETRYIINDVASKRRVPWIYGGVVGTHGMVLPIIPRKTPCLRCLWPEPPQDGATCNEVGVLAPAVHIVASMQVIEAMKILTGQEIKPELVHIDVWTGKMTRLWVERDCQRPHSHSQVVWNPVG